VLTEDKLDETGTTEHMPWKTLHCVDALHVSSLPVPKKNFREFEHYTQMQGTRA
jgi:hypothetical protein